MLGAQNQDHLHSVHLVGHLKDHGGIVMSIPLVDKTSQETIGQQATNKPIFVSN